MERNPTFNRLESGNLRARLEDHLVTIFFDGTISQYLAIDGHEPELQIMGDCCENALALPLIKFAFDIWQGMDAADRHNVLWQFHRLYATLTPSDIGNRKTLIFCALFVHEFAAILAEAMEWPD